jgi:hypothetical protein
LRERILRFIRSLRSRKGSQTMEYIVIIAVGALFATILLNAIQSESIQAAIVEKVRCAILFSGEGCKDPQSASGNTKPAANNYPPAEHTNPDPAPIPPVPPQAQANSYEQELKQPWYKCLFSINCLEKTGSELIEDIKDFIVLDEDDLRKEALQHCDQDAECIQKYIHKKRLSAGLHFSLGLGSLSHSIEKLTGWNPLDALADFAVEHPFEALATALFLVSIPFTGPVGVGGAVGVGATESALGGVGAAAIAGLGRWLSRRYFPRVASWLASKIPLPSWATRFLPVGMEGGFTASAESGWFDWIRDGKINWKKALVNGALGVAVGLGTPFIMDGIGTGLQQMRHLPVAFEITPEGSILAKRLGDTEAGQKLQDAGDAIRRFAGTGDEVVTRSRTVVNNVPKYQEAKGNLTLSDVAEIRKELGLPAITNEGNKKYTVAVLEADGVRIWGRSGNEKQDEIREVWKGKINANGSLI